MSRALFMVPAAMSLIAIAPMPYGYYQFLKLVIFLAGGLIGFQFWTRGRTVLAVPFILLALLFNPIFPVHLTREIWTAINAGIVRSWRRKGSPPSPFLNGPTRQI